MTETALAEALKAATAFGQWGLVAQLAAALQAQPPRCSTCGLQLAEYAGADGSGRPCMHCEVAP